MADEVIDPSGQIIHGHQVNVAGDATIGRVGDSIDTGGGDYVARDKIINYYVETKTIVSAVSLQEIEQLPPKRGDPPYKGLAYFMEKDKDFFFGRDDISNSLVKRLQNTRFLALIGASGSGKSSLLRAGIIPRLRMRNWRIHVISPGAHPLAALANSLTRDDLDPDSTDRIVKDLASKPDTLLKTGDKLAIRVDAERLLVAVDQFEALFTQCKVPGEQKAFVDNLVTVAGAQGTTTVLVSMRADFYNRISEFADLTDLVSQNQEYVKPLAQEDLVRVIAGPAKRGGWQFVEGLVEEIVEDVGLEPGRLPLLSHALLETWERRRDTIMTLGGYRDAGGVKGAIAKTAEDTLKRLNKEQVPIVKHVFLSLTELGEGAEDTRRIASSQELLQINADEDAINKVVEALVNARLITIDKDHVEVAHEALIRRWPRLHSWIDEDRERLSFNRRLMRAANEWGKNERENDYLFRGSQLEQAESRIDEYSNWKLSELQAGFINASQDLAEQEKKKAGEIEEIGHQNALRSTVFALFGGALGLGTAAMLINRSAELAEFFTVIYITLALGVGAIAGLIYVPIFDRIVSAVEGHRVWQSWLASILVGICAFALALGWLLNFIPDGWSIILLIGSAWGAVAGAGRLWIQRRDLSILLSISLISLFSGIALAGAYLVAQWLRPQWLDSWPQPLLEWLFFIIGVLVPLIILMAEYAAQYISGRSEQ